MRLKLSTLVLLCLMILSSGELLLKELNPEVSLIGSACSISEYFSCDKASSSEISKVNNIPLSYIGFILSTYFLFLYTFFRRKIYDSLYPISFINLGGVLSLFFYSLFELKSLCPLCLVYQISAVSLCIQHTFSSNKKVIFKLFILNSLILLILFALPLTIKKESKVAHKKSIYTEQEIKIINVINKRVKVGNPLVDSKYWLVKNRENFLETPIHISIFSDFQCPACKELSKQLRNVVFGYENQVNIQYINFPLDNTCNRNIFTPMHTEACLMSKIFLCSKDKSETYNYLFANQEVLDKETLDTYIKKNELETCIRKPSTRSELKNQINQADLLGIKATPTMIINGIKIEGLIKDKYLKTLFKYLKNKKK